MYTTNFYEQFTIDKQVLDILQFNPYYSRIESGTNGSVTIHKKDYIDLASNNYLGLSTDQRVIDAIVSAVKLYGASMCGTPIATGSIDLLSNLEEELANFLGLEATALFPSCYQANLGLFSILAGKGDLILVDHYAHASLINGIQVSGCKIMPFLHNDMNHLENLLKKSSGYNNRYVVTESVFSTEGTIAPFDIILKLCMENHAIPVIDDSHGIGVLGRNGKGILEEKNIRDYCGIYTTSLGKALANNGGIVAGKKKFIDFLKYSCPSLIYSTALSPAMVGGIQAVLKILKEEYDTLYQRLRRNKRMLQECLGRLGVEQSNGKAMIVSIKCGNTHDTILMAKNLFEKKILCTPFVPPSVPVNKGVVRLIPGAGISHGKMLQVVESLEKIASADQSKAYLYIIPAHHQVRGNLQQESPSRLPLKKHRYSGKNKAGIDIG
jgi:7-keto-8-aminopelargonate synthetase-like enzyme